MRDNTLQIVTINKTQYDRLILTFHNIFKAIKKTMQSVQGKPDNVSDNGNNETDTVKKKKKVRK